MISLNIEKMIVIQWLYNSQIMVIQLSFVALIIMLRLCRLLVSQRAFPQPAHEHSARSACKMVASLPSADRNDHVFFKPNPELS